MCRASATSKSSRILALFLAVVLLLSMAPMAYAAEDGEETGGFTVDGETQGNPDTVPEDGGEPNEGGEPKETNEEGLNINSVDGLGGEVVPFAVPNTAVPVADLNELMIALGSGATEIALSGAITLATDNYLNDLAAAATAAGDVVIYSKGTERHFVIAGQNIGLNLGDSIILDGDSTGGGIQVENTSSGTFTLKGGTLRKCYAAVGGAMYINTAATTVNIEKTTFDGNKTPTGTTNFGGGIYRVAGTSGNNGELYINGATFTNNLAYSGGAMYINKYNNIEIGNSHFEGNGTHVATAMSQGGCFLLKGEGVTLKVSDTQFVGNTAGAGGVTYSSGGGLDPAYMGYENCRFEDNVAKTAAGVFRYDGVGHLYIDDCQLIGNKASSSGGVIYGTLSTAHTSGKLTVKNSLFEKNSGFTGGAINLNNANSGLDVQLENVTFRDNQSISDDYSESNDNYGYGGGALYISGNVDFTLAGDNLFEGNTAKDPGGAITFSIGSTQGLKTFTVTGTTTFKGNTSAKVGGAMAFSRSYFYQNDINSYTIGWNVSNGKLIFQDNLAKEGFEAPAGSHTGNTLYDDFPLNEIADDLSVGHHVLNGFDIDYHNTEVEGKYALRYAYSFGMATTLHTKGATVNLATQADDKETTSKILVGWNTQADGNGTDLDLGDPITLTENTTVYPRWSDGYTVYFYNTSVDADIPFDTQQLNIGDTLKVPDLPTPESKYYVPVHWSTDKDNNGTAYEPGETIKAVANGELHLYTWWNKIAQTKSGGWSGILNRTTPIAGGQGMWDEKNATGNYALNMALYAFEGEEVEYENYTTLRLPSLTNEQKAAGLLHGDIHFTVGTAGTSNVTMTLPDFLIPYVSADYVDKTTGELIMTVDDLATSDPDLLATLSKDHNTGPESFLATTYYFMIEGKDIEQINQDVDDPEGLIKVTINERRTITAADYYGLMPAVEDRVLHRYEMRSFQDGIAAGAPLVEGGNAWHGTSVTGGSFSIVNPDLGLELELEPADKTVKIGDTVEIKLTVNMESTAYLDDVAVEIYNAVDDTSTKRLDNMANLEYTIYRPSGSLMNTFNTDEEFSYEIGPYPGDMSYERLGGAAKETFTFVITFDYVVSENDIIDGKIPLYATLTGSTMKKSLLYTIEPIPNTTKAEYTPIVDSDGRYTGPAVKVVKELEDDANGVLRLTPATVIYHSNYDSKTDVHYTVPGTLYLGHKHTVLAPTDQKLNFSEDGYIFTGWNTAADGTGTPYNPGDLEALSSATLELFAQWAPRPANTYQVIYDANTEGDPYTGGVNDYNTYTAGQTVTVLPNGFTRGVYTFVEWNTRADGKGTSYDPTDTFNMPASNVTLYAIWHLETYRVYYDANTGGNPYTGTVTDPNAYAEQEKVTVLPNGFQQVDYTFVEWNEKADGTGKSYDPNDTFNMPASDVTLYAIWDAVPANTYRVYYDANTGGETYTGTVVDNNLYTPGDEAIVLPNAFDRDGYTFTGWNEKPDGTGTPYKATEKITIVDEDVYLYAQWQKKSTPPDPGRSYKLTYHPCTDLGEQNVVYTINAGTKVTVQPGTIFTAPEGYTFAGWSETEKGTVRYQSGDTFTMPSRDVDLYAIWEGDETPSLDKDNHFAYIVGYPDGTVKPEGNITRQEIATIFFRLLTREARAADWATTNPYSDVPGDLWSNNAISTLTNAGILDGYEDGTFRPGRNVTRAEMAAMAARFSDVEYDGDSPFNDIDGHWAEVYIKLAAHLGYVEGRGDGGYHPDDYMTRAEVMTLINRVLGRYVEREEDLLDGMITWPDNWDTGTWFYFTVQEATNSHYHEHYTNDKGETVEKWTELRTPPNWSVLEKPGATPDMLVY